MIVDVQKTDFMPVLPFIKDGAEVQPMFEFEAHLTAEALSAFYRMHLSFRHQKGMNLLTAAGFFLIGLAAGEFLIIPGAQGYVFELGCGLFITAFSFFLGPYTARAMLRRWKGPDEVHYQFFEDGYQEFSDHGLERRPYGRLQEIYLTRDALYLYTEKDRAYILPLEALGGRLSEFVAFLEAKSGKKAVRIGRRKAA